MCIKSYDPFNNLKNYKTIKLVMYLVGRTYSKWVQKKIPNTQIVTSNIYQFVCESRSFDTTYQEGNTLMRFERRLES